MSFPMPHNEDERLNGLRSYDILDTPTEGFFDDIALAASAICQTPIALMSLVDDKRQWFKARVGLEISETPREQAFCSYTILGTEVMVVKDAAADGRFSDNPLVKGFPGIRFYAGAPLIDRKGVVLGSLCVIDRKPREITQQQKAVLCALSRIAIRHMELLRLARKMAEDNDDFMTTLARMRES